MINFSLLVSAPMLQDYLVDNASGLPMANGTITLYQDNSRTTLKNWYYQTGTPGNYTYITLPNPMTLSAVGTMEDANGNDIIPFYYPYSEVDNQTVQAYYIVVANSNGQQQFTRQNFPFVPPSSSVTNTNTTLTNYIVNNVFWRNIGSLSGTQFANTASSIVINGNTLKYVALAPSQHDGHIMPDILYFKDQTNATETISFNTFVNNFPDNPLPNDVTPEFYLNLNCTGAGTETVKYIQFPIELHVDNFSGYTQASASIWVQNVGGNVNNIITLKLFQFLGTGVTSPVAATIKTITATNAWQKQTVNFTFPTSQALTLGNGGDDAWYLQVSFPVALTCDINIAKPSIYLSETQPTDEFQNYDVVASIFDSPRTGDIRTSLNKFSPYGWLPMDDGTIGNPSSNSTARANKDTWPLYNLLWGSFQPYDSGSNSNPICQMYSSGGAATNYGGSAISDFNANKALALTKMMGRVLLGTVPIVSLLSPYTTNITASNNGGNLLITTSNNVNYFNGMTIAFTNSGGSLPGGLVSNAIYYVSGFNGTNSFGVAISFANMLAGTIIAYTSAGSGTNTVIGAVSGTIEGEYAHTQLTVELAQHNHTINRATSGVAGPVNAWFPQGTSPNVAVADTNVINTTGASAPFNVTQPGTFYNIFIKL